MPTLSAIHVYPIKSVSGIAVDRWPVTAKGLLYDRKWMLVDGERRFLSQRRLAKMALIRTRMTGDGVILSAPGMTDILMPLTETDGETLSVEIWHDTCVAKTVSAELDRWFQDFLGIACRLVYHPDGEMRRVDPRYAAPSDQTAFSDGFPFLIVSEQAMTALNQVMELNMTLARFRPNLVIGDCAAFAEDYWRRIAIDGIGFRLPKPCSRCGIPAIDPATGNIGKEPLLTLSKRRQWQNKTYFGQNALHDRTGELCVGSAVTLLETGDAQPPLSWHDAGIDGH
ncbi:MAG: MOSC domain-containing protein [Methylomonas sp.]|nr:MOSC domain-containing protein [Methylomonas sp.]PPD22587.1 MAG: MOSC domain-containing protein [Methylomonas sp.]PPD27897.1 MAG: MOSC domain-containing protein [Methylomonas sp.]PPD40007.1 MAG: MOSC domain-containing protein [Methylomonas sp.]PPD51999.1 MAG: MOSC domain-containing protein [Methylomonas sp.]